MKKMTWLLRREFWEHKGSFFWTPLVVGLLMLLFMGGTLLLTIDGLHLGNFEIDGHPMSQIEMINAIPATQKSQLIAMLARGYLAFSAPLLMVLAFISFFYCLGALYDERRDRSILFWKSLPASDQMTVVSKVLAALCVAPVITLAVATAVSMAMLLLLGLTAAVKGVNLLGPVLASAEFYLAPLRLLGLLPVYFLWALPTVGWLLLVSAWARSKPFLWAVGTPLLTVLMIKWLNFLLTGYSNYEINVDWFVRHIVVRGLGGLIPGIWMDQIDPAALMPAQQHVVDPAAVFVQSWLTLGGPGVWIGVAAGAAMIVAAARLRRWREEG